MREVIGGYGDGVSSGNALYIAARAPRPGFTKSRLGRTIGNGRAATLYAAFLRDLARRFVGVPFTVGWYVTPDDALAGLAPLIPNLALPTGERDAVLVQPPGDWTERQRSLFTTAAARNERRTVLIASDSPQIGPDLVVSAFERLGRDDIVLGPTEDGGYYLIGMRTGGDAGTVDPWAALAGVRMSTGSVLDEILAQAASLGLRASLLPATFDIDEEADLARLIPLALQRDDLSATRYALQALGLIPDPVGAAVSTQTPLAVGSAR